MNPFTEKQIGKQTFVRTFNADTPNEELIWHLDKENRIIESMDYTDWQFQFDNELPISLNNQIKIPKNTFHRIIKGSGDCTLKVIKLDESY